MSRVTLEIPLIPPSVNMYVRHTRTGRHYVTREAKAFKEALALFAHGQCVQAKKYKVSVCIYLGHGQRGDIDNFQKVILDGLADAGVIKSDAKIETLNIHKSRDRENPRTVITVEEI